MKKLNEKNNENYDFELKQKVVEALIFSSSDPVPYDELLKRISDKNILNEILENLEKKYSSSGVNLFVINDAYAFRTSLDVSEMPRICYTLFRKLLEMLMFFMELTKPLIMLLLI